MANTLHPMSLYRRLRAWWLRNDNSGPDGPCLFDQLTPDLCAQVLSYLDVPSLKSCMSVSTHWENQLYRSGILSRKSRKIWRGYEVMDWNEIILKFVNLATEPDRTWTPEFCMEGFGSAKISLLVTPALGYTFLNVTHFELKKSSVKLVDLKILLTKFDRLSSLYANDINVLPTEMTTNTETGILPWMKTMFFGPNGVAPPSLPLKSLKIQIEKIWKSMTTLSRNHALSLMGNYFTGLVHFTFQLFDVGIEDLDDSLFHHVFPEIVKIIRSNARTLKTFTLNTFSHEADRVLNLYPNREDVAEGQYHVYIWFVNALAHFTDWDEIGLQLEKLDLKFRLVKTDEDVVYEVFSYFLRTQTTLKELNLSFAHLPEPAQDVIDRFVSCVPEFCKIQIEGIEILRDLLSFNGQIFLHFNQPFLGVALFSYPNEPFPLQQPQPQIAVSIRKVKNGPLAPLLLANGMLMVENHANFLLQPEIEKNMVLGHLDSTAEVETPKINLSLRFVQATSIQDIQFMTQNMNLLTKLKIQQVGVPFQRKIVIRDGDLQEIIRDAVNMTDLWFEFCNLSGVTDFGLTGISPDAANRMRTLENYEIQDGDRTGLPISRITGLRSLKLNDVGLHVTIVSAHHAFNGLNNLKEFSLFKPNMTREGFSRIRDLFKYNQYIQLEPRLK